MIHSFHTSGLYESQKKIEMKLSKRKRLLIMLVILRNVFILSFSLCLVACMKEVSYNIQYLFICIINGLLRHIHHLLHMPALVFAFTCVCWMQVLCQCAGSKGLLPMKISSIVCAVVKSNLTFCSGPYDNCHTPSLSEQICCSCQRSHRSLRLKGVPSQSQLPGILYHSN